MSVMFIVNMSPRTNNSSNSIKLEQLQIGKVETKTCASSTLQVYNLPGEMCNTLPDLQFNTVILAIWDGPLNGSKGPMDQWKGPWAQRDGKRP